MNKDKFLEIRKLEKEEFNCFEIIERINNFLNNYEDFSDIFQKKDVIEAVNTIKIYIELLHYKVIVIRKKINDLLAKYEKECKHEFVFYDAREDNSEIDSEYKYFCPLCRRYQKEEGIFDNTLIIDVEDIYNCMSPEQGSQLYQVIDYLVENDLDFTEKEFIKSSHKLFSHKIYGLIQVRRRK